MSPRLSTHHRRGPGQHPGRAEARGAHQVRPRRAGDARHIGRGHPAGRGGAVIRFADRQHPHQAAALHPRGQGRGADRRLLQAADRGLAQRRAGAIAGHRQRRGLGRERRGARRVQRHALDHRLRAAPARCQYRRGHRRHQQGASRIPAAAAAHRQAQRLERPIGIDPRRRARRADSR